MIAIANVMIYYHQHYLHLVASAAIGSRLTSLKLALLQARRLHDRRLLRLLRQGGLLPEVLRADKAVVEVVR